MSEKEVRRRLLETSKMISELRELIENRSDRKYDESTSHGLSKLVGPFGSVDDSFSPSVDPASQDKIEQDIIKSLEEVDSRLQSQDYEQALALIEFVVEALPSILPSDHFLVVKANSIYKKCESYKVIKLVQEVLVTPSTVLI